MLAFTTGALLGFASLPDTHLQGVCPGSNAWMFTPYFSYTGNLSVNGAVSAYAMPGGDTMIYYWLGGVDGECVNGPDTSLSANSCGIHIHTGTSCTEDAGGHYYTGAEDPWGAGYYKAVPRIGAAFGAEDFLTVPGTGLSSADMTGKTMIVHGLDGGRIACAVVGAPTPVLSVGPFTKYYSYAGELTGGFEYFSGGYAVSMEGMTSLNLGVLGVDPACATGPNTTISANSCGIHIHEGTSCTADALGHYYADNGMADPWGAGAYYTILGVYASAQIYLYTGLTNADITGKVVVVHDHSGGRTHCAPIQAPPGELKAAQFAPYPGYTGDLTVSGMLLMTNFAGPDGAGVEMLTFGYNLKGVDPRCAESWTATAANACGIHVHAGYSCEDAGGHLYGEMLGDDPWAAVMYTSYLDEATGAHRAGSPSVVVPAGTAYADLIGRAFVVHDFDGARISCDVLRPLSEDC
jgi:hypothetical protein